MGHGGLRLANNYIDGRFPHNYPDRESYADSFCLTPVYGILARQLIRTSTKIRILDQHTQHIPEERILLVCLRSQKRKLDRLKPDRTSTQPKPDDRSSVADHRTQEKYDRSYSPDSNTCAAVRVNPGKVGETSGSSPRRI